MPIDSVTAKPLTWSVPILIAEFSLGRHTRCGPIGAFSKLLGPHTAWMGAFIAFVATAILFYYSVAAGWTVRYVVASLSGEVPGANLRAAHRGRRLAPVQPLRV